EHAYLRVSDNGPGIPAEVRNRIFEPFFSTKGDKGTGLGLATCFGVVQRAEGLIEVESTSAEGTTFAVYLPLTVPSEEPRDSYISAAPASSHRRRVLIVEDQQTVLRFTAHTLRDHGYEVVTVGDAEAALQQLKEETAFDLVLSDINLPGQNGFELYNRAMGELEKAPPFLLMSGFIDRRELPRQIAAADVPLITKPFEAGQLLVAAGKAIRRASRTRDETGGALSRGATS